MKFIKVLTKKTRTAFFPLVAALTIITIGCEPQSKISFELFDPAAYDIRLIVSSNMDSLSIMDGTLNVNFVPGKYGSEISIKPRDGIWDASAFRFVRCEIENTGNTAQLVELGFGDYDLTLGATFVQPGGKKTLKAVVYRNQHPAILDSLFPVMHGKPDGTLRSWMKSTSDSIKYIKLLFPIAQAGSSVKIGRIWFEGPYKELTEEELKAKYYPFVDKYGQLNFNEWKDKIHIDSDLTDAVEKEKTDLENHPRSGEWNKFGGWANGPSLNATGRFRVEKYEGKWSFVDPEGKLFWSNGFDCVEFEKQSQTRISGRELYFEYLPSTESGETEFYSISGEGENKIKNLSFYSLNLFRKYGKDWKELSNENIHKRMGSWGFNTIGNWSDPEIYLSGKTPYVLTIYTKKTGEISDPYQSGYQDDLQNSLSAAKAELEDPWCIGVFVDNELKWGVKWASKIADQVLTAPETQPAKVYLMKMLEKKYGAINELNNAWDTNFKSWKEFLGNNDAISKAYPDLKEFMKEFATLYYSTCKSAVKKVAPELLYMGCRMDFHLYPEDTTLNDIIQIASEYCDVVSFNRYRYSCAELVPPNGGDFPIIIGEYHFGSLETGLLQPGLRYAADQIERAELFEYFLTSAIKNPYIIGAHWFQLVDQSVAGRGDGENYQAGFLTAGDVPQQEMIDKSREIGYNMYKTRFLSR